MSYKRELVEYFLRYKLSQRNYPFSLLSPKDVDCRAEGEQRSPAASYSLLGSSRNRSGASPPTEAVRVALRDSAQQFEKLFVQAFVDLSSQLITPDTIYQSFKNMMAEMFKDGVIWG